jgi:hypothetical protein
MLCVSDWCVARREKIEVRYYRRPLLAGGVPEVLGVGVAAGGVAGVTFCLTESGAAGVACRGASIIARSRVSVAESIGTEPVSCRFAMIR